MSKTKIYKVWHGMKRRCYDAKEQTYQNYGGRGIKVCERWHSFENFYADMGDRPDGYEIDRIDNNGDYEPSNCRWASRKEQFKNKRNTVFMTKDGVTKPLIEWAEDLGINRRILYNRKRRGMSDHDALTKVKK